MFFFWWLFGHLSYFAFSFGWLLSQAGPHAAVPFTKAPATPEYTLDNPPISASCCNGGCASPSTPPRPDAAAAAPLTRTEITGRVPYLRTPPCSRGPDGTRLSPRLPGGRGPGQHQRAPQPMNLAPPVADGRQIEVLAQRGSHGAQLAVDATLTSPATPAMTPPRSARRCPSARHRPKAHHHLP
jgi:hypothetical protein